MSFWFLRNNYYFFLDFKTIVGHLAAVITTEPINMFEKWGKLNVFIDDINKINQNIE